MAMAVPQPAFPSPNASNRASDQVKSVNPATNEVIASFPAADASALPEIFCRARDAQKDWAETCVRGRREMLRLLRDAIFARLRAGSAMINDVASYYAICGAPHGGRGESGWGRTHSRLGLLEMVQPKYVDVDLLPRLSKPWWFGYSADFAEAADRFVELLFAPSWRTRRRAAADKRLRLLLSRRDKI